MKNLQKGFSLIELLVVVAIIGILAAIGSVGYSKYINSAKSGAAQANAAQASQAIQALMTLKPDSVFGDVDTSGTIMYEVKDLAVAGLDANAPSKTCDGTVKGKNAVVITTKGGVYYCDAAAETPAWVQQSANVLK